jgi:2-isopropylmalate synthase
VASVCLWNQDGTFHRQASVGDGPVDAVFKTIERITGIDVTLRDFHIRSVTVGEDAQGEASIEAEANGRTIRGRAVSTDIIEASALAFLQVINRIALRQQQPRLHPQKETVVNAT